jgi:hypothetical protein
MTLLEKLMEIKKAMPYLQKESENKAQGFKYVSSSQVLKVFREKCDEINILVVPQIMAHNVTTTPSGKQLLTEITVEYTFINVDDPADRFNLSFYAQGADQGEKGVGKALTYAEKYMILKLFNIPTDHDDPDAHIPDKVQPQKDVARQEPKQESKVDAKTQNFLQAMKNIETRLIARDGNANGMAMTLRMKGFKGVESVTESKDREEIARLLMQDLDIDNINDLLK